MIFSLRIWRINFFYKHVGHTVVIVLIAPLATLVDAIRIILSLVDHASQIVQATVIPAQLPTLVTVVPLIIIGTEVLVQVTIF